MKSNKVKFILVSIIMALLVAITIVAYKPVLNNLNYGLDLKGGFEVLYQIEPLQKGNKVTDDMMKSTYKAISNRVDTLGVSEPEITIEGNKIRVKLAGVTNEKEARDRLSTPAVLSFRNTSDDLLMNADILGTPAAKLDYNSQKQPVVSLKIDDKDKFYSVTKKISESTDQTIVIWLDFKEGVNSFSKETSCGRDGNMSCISNATVKQAFSSDVIIEGGFTVEEAQSLVDLVNSGSLPTKLNEVSSKTVDASFGSDTLKVAGIAGVIVMILIILVMTLVYRFSGFISGLCMLIYSFLVFLVFILIDGVLTLPGIAALILGIGMAVDASIISLERIKDELRYGKSLEASEKEGNKRSLTTIIDANITTFIIALVLFIFGESSVKGFATVLMITIILTIITMVCLNRVVIKEFVKTGFFGKRIVAFTGINKKNIVKLNSKDKPKEIFGKLDFVKPYKFFFAVSIIVLLIGFIFLGVRGLNLGIDFTGGSDISIKSTENISLSNTKNILKDYKIDESELVNKKEAYVKITDTLNKNQINEIKDEFKKENMSAEISVISNIVKKEMVKNAIISVILACIGILIYVGFRFTWKFSVGGVVALVHDALMMIVFFAMLYYEVNFIFIAAILTILGYSINDTIVCFDRARENCKKLYNNEAKSRDDLVQVVNISIRETLFRSLFTALTTMIAVLVLIICGANEIFNFNIAILIGLVAGSYSSIFIAMQIWLLLEAKSIGKEKKKPVYDDELEEKTIKGINS